MFHLNGGDKRNRTADPLLARQVLSQLSYTPILFGVVFTYEVVPSKLNNTDVIDRDYLSL